MSILQALEGKKTYLIAFITAAIGLGQAFFPDFVIPEWANYLLAAVGVTTVRMAIAAKP